ncbi:hypothetical protein QQS21_005378 [Conoideocrella luteorostrata]|uniref:Uncharacterized protein n=1 Tax=Conoideocrella luteorostrata TaxID=1105319 RepID=A0AAJ0CPM2_9HYPO|nr:hypothetical protein QQS21_005378 [Conoideocrella luteorostrata]
MKIVAGWVLGLAFAAASVNGFLFSTSRFNLVDRKYDFSDVAGATWQGEALPGRSITLRGTLQEIRRSIAAVNPEFLAAYNETSEEIGSGLKKRWVRRHRDPETRGHMM